MNLYFSVFVQDFDVKFPISLAIAGDWKDHNLYITNDDLTASYWNHSNRETIKPNLFSLPTNIKAEIYSLPVLYWGELIINWVKNINDSGEIRWIGYNSAIDETVLLYLLERHGVTHQSKIRQNRINLFQTCLEKTIEEIPFLPENPHNALSRVFWIRELSYWIKKI